MAQFIDCCERPCDHAARVCLHRFSSSPELVDIPVRNRDGLGGYGGDEGFFGLF